MPDPLKTLYPITKSRREPRRELEWRFDAPPEQVAKLLELRERVACLPRPWAWAKVARPEQLPPEGDWFVWLILAGRGFGKSRAGSEWLARQALVEQPGRDFAVIARSSHDLRATCLEGPSGLLRALGLDRDSAEYNRSLGEVHLANGSTIRSYAAESPDRLRGPNLSAAWADELAAWRYQDEAWREGLIPALRIGNPRVVVTTTPRRTRLLKELLSRTDGSVCVTRGSTFDNAANLSAAALAELKRRYDGTRIGRQELYGELLDDVEGALWNTAMLEHRVAWADGVFDSGVPLRQPPPSPGPKR